MYFLDTLYHYGLPFTLEEDEDLYFWDYSQTELVLRRLQDRSIVDFETLDKLKELNLQVHYLRK